MFLGRWICRRRGKHVPGEAIGHSHGKVWFVCKRCGAEFYVQDLSSILAHVLGEEQPDKYAAEIGRKVMDELFD